MKKLLAALLLTLAIPAASAQDILGMTNWKINVFVTDQPCVLGTTVFPADKAVRVVTVDQKITLTGCIKVVDKRVILGLNIPEKVDGKNIILIELDMNTFKELTGV